MDAPITTNEPRTIIDQLLGITFNLVQVDDPTRPTKPKGLASGFVIEKDGQKYFLTAGHAAKNGPWFWECALDAHEGCLLVPMGPFMKFVAGSLSSSGKMVIDASDVPAGDFAWSPFDPTALSKKLRDFSGPKAPLPYEYYQGPLDRSLAPRETCVLAAHSRGTIEHLRLTYLRREVCVQDLQFQFTNEKGHHVFKPIGGHQGHDFYRGASGAPIANSNGELVSMLIGGDDARDEIYGQPLALIAHLAGFDPTSK